MTKKILPSLSLSPDKRNKGYTTPVYHDKGKSFYVDFLAYDPSSDSMRRKKYHLDHISQKRERKKQANLLIYELNEKLAAGWSPWADDDACHGNGLLEDVFNRYIEGISVSHRKKTLHSYSSRINILKVFIKTLPNEVRFVRQFDRRLVLDFLDWLLLRRGVNARTRNNYKGWCISFGAYLVDRGYLPKNPCEGIPKISEKPKKRKALSGNMLKMLYRYLDRKDKYFLLAVLMQYYTLIRPSELVNVRICDFRLMDQTVFVPAEFSKNKRDGCVGVNEIIIRLMLDLNIFSNPGDFYLFSKDFKPGERRMGPDIFNKRWHMVRHALKWGDEYQFYSLKDSGIRDLANHDGIVVARDQARHTDVSTTNKYLGPAEKVWNETKVFKGGLS